MNAEDTGRVAARTTWGAEAWAARLPGAHGEAAFDTVHSEVLFGVFEARGGASLVYCGDGPAAKAVASALIRNAGFAPVDAGPPRVARYIEPFALSVASLAYGSEGGPELAHRFERLGPLGP